MGSGDIIGWQATLTLSVMDPDKDVAQTVIEWALQEGGQSVDLTERVKLEPIYRRHTA